MTKAMKERDKLTLSFASEDLKKPMNELLNSWEERGYRLSTKGVTALIEMNHLSNSDHFSLVSSTYHYIYRNLKKVYGENQEALYEAVDEILAKVVQIDTSQLMHEIQRKAEEGRQLSLKEEYSGVTPLPKGLTTPTINEKPSRAEMPEMELGAPVLDTQQMIQSKREMEQLEAQRTQQREEEAKLQQEKEALAQQKKAIEEMQKQMQAQMQQFAQMQQMAQMQVQMAQPMMQPIMQPITQPEMQSVTQPEGEESEKIDKEQAAQGFKSLMDASPF